MKNLLIIFVLIASILSSCSFERRALRKGYVKKDSATTVINTTLIDTTITYNYTISGDSIIQIMRLECDSMGNVYIAKINQQKGEIFDLTQKLDSNTLFTKVIYRDRNIPVQGRDRTFIKYKDKNVYVTEYKTPKFWKIMGYIGILTCIVFLILVVRRIIKTFKR